MSVEKGPIVQRVWIALGLLLAVGCREDRQPSTPAPPTAALPQRIDAKQAVRIAEQFIRENGYTDIVPSDPGSIEPESIEFAAEGEDRLANRHDTLRPEALGYRMGGRNNPMGWTVGFELVKPLEDPDVGRAVTMGEHGEDVMIQHMGFSLRNLEPRPE